MDSAPAPDRDDLTGPVMSVLAVTALSGLVLGAVVGSLTDGPVAAPALLVVGVAWGVLGAWLMKRAARRSQSVTER